MLLSALLFLTALAPGQDDAAWFPIEDVTGKALGYSAQNGPAVLITSFVNPKLTWVDLQRGQARVLDDGRYRQYIGFPVPYRDGFALLTRMIKMVYLIDAKGAFVDQVPLSDIAGWEDGWRITLATPYGDGYLLTLDDGPDARVVARLDLEGRTLTRLFAQKIDPDDKPRWLARGTELLCFQPATGRITRVDATGRTTATLREAQTPVPRGDRPGRTRYLARVDLPRLVGDRVYFSYRRLTDRFGNVLEEPETLSLMLDDSGIHEVPAQAAGRLQDTWLRWHDDDREFVLGPEPAP